MDSIMNKRAIFILGLVTLFFASVYVGAKIEGSRKTNSLADDIGLIEEKQNVIVNEVSLSINANEEKTTPNTKFVLKKYYTHCNHRRSRTSRGNGKLDRRGISLKIYKLGD